MGNRLTRIYTRTGDEGKTGLGTGARVDKDHARIEAIGDIDELNSLLGLLLCADLPQDIRSVLGDIQHTLFDIGGELSLPGVEPETGPGSTLALPATPVTYLEQQLDAHNSTLPPLREFILPGGTEAAARCHLARAVCRRAERRMVTLARAERVNPHVLAYLNRLSDLLFVIARVLTRHGKGDEVYWRKPDARS